MGHMGIIYRFSLGGDHFWREFFLGSPAPKEIASRKTKLSSIY